MKAYEMLAKFYDSLNGDVDYAAMADFYEKIFREAGKKPELVLDLGCGTGSMTLELARRGYDMIGVDGSPEMLTVANERKFAAGHPEILLLCQDVREFELYGTVGAAVSSLDVMNYLTGDGDLSKCFALVHNYLDPDGIFIFDVNTPYKFEHVFGDNAYILEDEECYCGWQNEYDKESGLCRFYLSLFEEKADGSYKREDEEQTERCYSREELTKRLSEAGFADIRFFGGCDGRAPEETSERWYVTAVCKK